MGEGATSPDAIYMYTRRRGDKDELLPRRAREIEGEEEEKRERMQKTKRARAAAAAAGFPVNGERRPRANVQSGQETTAKPRVDRVPCSPSPPARVYTYTSASRERSPSRPTRIHIYSVCTASRSFLHLCARARARVSVVQCAAKVCKRVRRRGDFSGRTYIRAYISIV